MTRRVGPVCEGAGRPAVPGSREANVRRWHGRAACETCGRPFYVTQAGVIPTHRDAPGAA